MARTMLEEMVKILRDKAPKATDSTINRYKARWTAVYQEWASSKDEDKFGTKRLWPCPICYSKRRRSNTLTLVDQHDIYTNAHCTFKHKRKPEDEEWRCTFECEDFHRPLRPADMELSPQRRNALSKALDGCKKDDTNL